MDHQQQSEVRIVSAQVLAQLQNAGYQVPKNSHTVSLKSFFSHLIFVVLTPHFSSFNFILFDLNYFCT